MISILQACKGPSSSALSTPVTFITLCVRLARIEPPRPRSLSRSKCSRRLFNRSRVSLSVGLLVLVAFPLYLLNTSMRSFFLVALHLSPTSVHFTRLEESFDSSSSLFACEQFLPNTSVGDTRVKISRIRQLSQRASKNRNTAPFNVSTFIDRDCRARRGDRRTLIFCSLPCRTSDR